MRIIKEKLIVVCLGIMLLAGVTGCAKTVDSSQQVQEDTGNELSKQVQENSGNKSGNAIEQKRQDNKTDSKTMQERTDSETDNNTVHVEESDENLEDALAQNEIGFQAGTEFLSGKIQSVEENGMIIAQTTILEDGMVTLVDEKDAKEISVKFIEDTKVEHWTIKGGGADIDRKDAVLSDLTAGMGVEMEGYYEGEAFVAIRVLIEEYV